MKLEEIINTNQENNENSFDVDNDPTIINLKKDVENLKKQLNQKIIALNQARVRVAQKAASQRGAQQNIQKK